MVRIELSDDIHDRYSEQQIIRQTQQEEGGEGITVRRHLQLANSDCDILRIKESQQ
jgi:hypothetical protein